jgi:hypothetical protein
MATWPSTLPLPQLAGYSLNPSDQTLRTSMDGGNAKVRRVSYTRNDKISCSLRLTDAQFAAFRTWFDDTAEANGGQSWFTVSLMVGATGIDTVEARFTGPWQGALLSYDYWDISLPLEVRYA